MTPQFDPGSGMMPSEIAALCSLALDEHRQVIAAREIVRCRESYMGRYYEGDTVLPWKPQAVHPKLNEIVERFRSILTDSRVKFAPKPRNDEDAILGKALISMADYEWERQRMDLKLNVAAGAVLIDGTTHLYTGLDADSRPVTKVLSPFAFVPDPSAHYDDDMAYGFIDFGMSRNEIEKKWPEFAQIIFDRVYSGTAPIHDENTFNAIGTNYQQLGGSGTLASAAQNAAGTSSPMEFSTPQNPSARQGKKFRVEEWWFAKGEDRQLNVDFADGSQAMVEFPATQGRRMYVIEGHYFPELDGPNPYEHGMIPVARMTALTLMNQYHGLPYIQPLLDTAEQIADIDNQIMANVRLMMHPIWLVPYGSRVDISKFFSAPGLVLPYREPHKPEAHTPPPLPQYVFELRRIKQEEFDRASGINEISSGSYSGSLDDVSGKAVQLLQRPTYTRMRPIQTSMEYGVTRWGYQTMCNAMQFTPEETWRKVLPEDIEDMPLPWMEPMRESVDRYMPEIKMEPGSNLPDNQDAKNGLVFNLFDRQAFGPPGTPEASLELMKGVRYPDAEQIAMQGAQAQQNMMMQQQQAAMMGQPPEMGAPPPAPGGANKALGGERGPADEQSVMGDLSGQEVGL